MATLSELTIGQLRKAIEIKEQIQKLELQLGSFAGNGASTKPAAKKGGMSAAGRARISAAAKARWAKIRGAGAKAKPAKKGGMSDATKAKLRAAAQARWAKIKGATAPASKPVTKAKRVMSAAGRAAISAAAKAMWARKAAAKK